MLEYSCVALQSNGQMCDVEPFENAQCDAPSHDVPRPVCLVRVFWLNLKVEYLCRALRQGTR